MADVLLGLIRHAPTAWNAEGRLQGTSDLPLSLAGEAEARRLRLPPAMRHWRRCSSPLQRAQRTARLLAPAMPVLTVEALREMSFGTWEGRTLSELRRDGGLAMAEEEARGLDMRPPDGETPREVMARLRPWLSRLSDEGRPVLAISHKGIQRALLALATGWTMHDKPPLRLRSRAVHLFMVARDGAVSLRQPNIALYRP